MRIYERIMFIIFAVAGFYICEHQGRKEGYENALRDFKENHMQEDTSVDHLQKDHKIMHCGNCIYSVQDMNNGHYECSNKNSFAYCDDISLDEYCKEWTGK